MQRLNQVKEQWEQQSRQPIYREHPNVCIASKVPVKCLALYNGVNIVAYRGKHYLIG